MTPILAQKYQPQARPRLVKINGLLAHAVSNRTDPTRTTGLRNRWAAEMGRRFSALRRLIWKAIVEQDCFGLGPAYTMFRPTVHTLSPPAQKAFDFPRLEDKIPAFMQWLQKQQDEGILELVSYPRLGQSLGDPWTNMFVKDSYSRGVQRARYELTGAGYPVPTLETTGGLVASLSTPFHTDRLASVYLRAFDQLKGITGDMDTAISTILSQGLADGDAPVKLAKKLNYVISGMGESLGTHDILGRFIPAERRAKMLARTEIIRSHALATLQEAKVWGAVGVTAQVEFVNAGFNVCPICQGLQGKVYTIEEAINIIPVHPHCRCAWIIKPMERSQ